MELQEFIDTNDDYLKIHNLSSSSSLIENDSLLTTQLEFKKLIDDHTNLGVYNRLNKSTKIIKHKLKNISKIIKEIKNIKNG